jgi:hypothetical protein
LCGGNVGEATYRKQRAPEDAKANQTSSSIGKQNKTEKENQVRKK